jgi:hypothetical protein
MQFYHFLNKKNLLIFLLLPFSALLSKEKADFKNSFGLQKLDLYSLSKQTSFVIKPKETKQKGNKKKKENQLLDGQITGDLNVTGSIYSQKSIVSNGVLTSLNGLRITNGGMNVLGNIYLNPQGNYQIILGNPITGSNISFLTTDQNFIFLAGGNIKFQSQLIGIPTRGYNLPLTIDADGNIKTSYSTKQKKENICYWKDDYFSEDTLDQITPCSFTYIDDDSHTEQWGFIAEDFVTTELEKIAIRDDQGTIITIDKDKLLVYMFSLLKTQHRKITELEARIAQLEKRNNL